MFDVKGKAVIVTGSAQGFGREFADRLLDKGAKVVISDVNEAAGAKTARDLGKKHGTLDRVHFVKLVVPGFCLLN